MVVHLRVAAGSIDVTAEPVAAPDARLVADPRTLFQIGSGGSTLADAVAEGRARVEGGPGAMDLLTRTLRFS